MVTLSVVHDFLIFVFSRRKGLTKCVSIVKDLVRVAHLTLTVGAAAILFATSSLSACNREPVERTSAERQEDEKLVQQVKATFNNSPSFKFPEVQVAAYKARVQLSGFVVSEDQKRSVENLAKNVPGVNEVENKISLKR